MAFPRKLVALASGTLVALSAAAVSQSQAQAPAGGRNASETVIVDNATVDWIQFSKVAALIDGNVEKMELEIGKPVASGGVIGYLYKKKAELGLRKADIAAKSTGAIDKAVAQKDQAVTVVSRNRRLIKQNVTFVSKEDQEKAEADLKVTVALIKEAEENQSLAAAERDLAKNALDEHTIRAPFAGIITKRLKGPGESVRANEPVVELGNLDRLRVFAFIPLEYAYRLSEGTVVEFRPKIEGSRGNVLPIEAKKFRGTVSFVDPKIQGVKETEVRIYAEFDNENQDLRPGLKGTLTIYLNPPGAPAPARTTAVAPEVPVGVSSPTAAVGGVELPQLPR